jgi:hypothetical protein
MAVQDQGGVSVDDADIKVHNAVVGTTTSSVVQAGAITGGVHHPHPAAVSSSGAATTTPGIERVRWPRRPLGRSRPPRVRPQYRSR